MTSATYTIGIILLSLAGASLVEFGSGVRDHEEADDGSDCAAEEDLLQSFFVLRPGTEQKVKRCHISNHNDREAYQKQFDHLSCFLSRDEDLWGLLQGGYEEQIHEQESHEGTACCDEARQCYLEVVNLGRRVNCGVGVEACSEAGVQKRQSEPS